MKKILAVLCLSLVAMTASAETNYVYVSGDNPMVVGTSCSYDVEKDSVTIGTSVMGGIDWSVVKVVSTTSPIPVPFTNINQIVILETVLPITTDEKKNWERLADKKLKAIITGLVKTINLRLPAGNKITAEELKQAIKDEL